MAKKNGLGATLSVDDSGGTARAISNDVLSLSVSTPRSMQDVTGIDKSAMERLLTLVDGKMDYAVVFNDTANTGSHNVLKTVPSSAVNRTHTYAVQGVTLAMEMVIGDYPLSRAADGALTASISAQLADGAVPTWA